MREIKFRAISSSRFPEINKMCYGTGIFEDGTNTWLLSHDPTKCMADNLMHHIIDKNTIGQFTGLKDKNGLQYIYEDDIIGVDGLVKGDKYENADLLQSPTNLLVTGFGTKSWLTTYQEAMVRGCKDSE